MPGGTLIILIIPDGSEQQSQFMMAASHPPPTAPSLAQRNSQANEDADWGGAKETLTGQIWEKESRAGKKGAEEQGGLKGS